MSFQLHQTRFLVLSDTHGDNLKYFQNDTEVDVVIHCGDLTEESKLHEFKSSIELLKQMKAPTKLVIAGNHDFTLDTPTFKQKLSVADPPLEESLVKQQFGDFGEARQLFDNDDAKSTGILFLDEGEHTVMLENGASLKIYASPYTSSSTSITAHQGAFQYNAKNDHQWSIPDGIDIVITHSPPRGVLDYTADRTRAGSPNLFAAIAKSRPKMHCFGHIHESWGAKRVAWRDPSDLDESTALSHFTAIDNDKSTVLQTLAGLEPRKFDDEDVVKDKKAKLEEHQKKGFCYAEEEDGEETTLFVNAAIEGIDESSQKLPWMVDIVLSPAPVSSDKPTNKQSSGRKRKRTTDTSTSVPTERLKR